MSFVSRIKRLIELSREPVAAPAVEAKEEKSFSLDSFNLAYWPKKAGIRTFDIPKPPPFVVPKRKNGQKLAMDDAVAQIAPLYEWAGAFGGGLTEGLGFPGYSYLAELTQRPEYRRPSEIISKELTREWLRFIAVGDEDKQTSGSLWGRLKVLKEEFSRLVGSPDPIDEVRRNEIKQEWADLIEQAESKGSKAEKIKLITEEFKRLKVRALFQRAMEQDGWFGRSHIWLETCDPNNLDELVLPLELDTVKIGKGDLKRLILVEAMWTYPNRYDAVDPLNEHFFKPYTWFVMGKEVHSSRLLTFVSRPVPDILKPVYQFGGMSLSQMLKPYVDNWLRTRQSVSNLVSNFSIMILQTDLAQLLQTGVSFGLLQRMQAFNASRDNNGLMVADKNMEDVKNVSVPLGSLDHLQAQAQEHQCVTADTMIQTHRGWVRADEILISDHVMTRNGLAPIVWCGQTGYTDELVEITTNRRSITVTTCHPIYISKTKEFVPARNVRPSDLLSVRRSLENTALLSLGEVVGGGVLKLATIATKKLVDCFIVVYGRSIAGQFQMAMTSIMRTATRITTNSIILSSCNIPSIWHPTPFKRSGSTITKQSIAASVKIAARITKRFCWGVQNIAAELARPLLLGKESVLSVRRILGRQPVYNLSVAPGHLPEYFANGVLTHNCAVTGLPLVKQFGITPSGLNASSEGELKVYYDWCESVQESSMSPNIEYLLKVVQLHLFGEIDHGIQPIWEPLWSLNELEQAQARKTEAEIDTIYTDAGVLDRTEVRRRIADDPKSPYGALDVDREVDPVGQVMEDPDELGEIISHAVSGRAKAEMKAQSEFPSAE